MEIKNEEIICSCCGSRDVKKVYSDLNDKSYFADGKFDMLKCSNCEFEFIFPSLNEKQSEKYYPKEGYYSFKHKNKLALKYHLVSAYYSSGKNLLLDAVLSPFKSLLYTYYVKNSDKDKNILEIGCGDGLKLGIYQKYGLKTFGIEPYGEKITNEEKNLGIMRSSFKDTKFNENYFDYIILKEVLEHVPEQELILKKIHYWLKRKGKLIITVPNTQSLWKYIFGKNWFGYDVPRHLYNYNSKNMKKFLEKLDFKVNKIRKYDNPYMLAGSLKFYLVDKTGKREHNLVFSNISKVLFTPISLIISYLGLGSLMEIECEKI